MRRNETIYVQLFLIWIGAGIASAFLPSGRIPQNAAFVSPRILTTTTIQTQSSGEEGEPSTVVADANNNAVTLRRVSRVEKFSRLPVWPAWNGVLLFLVSKLLGEEVSAKLEAAIGGRVCPNFFTPQQTSPFVMLVHHCHSFAPWDPLRYFQRTFFPEGFPAHPHRGFVTVTYFFKGGFVHRDSMGIKQTYGAEDRHGGKHTQWLTTGAGVLHEEMFDLQTDNWIDALLKPTSQELYQLWLNLPSQHKMTQPLTRLLGSPEETPTVVTKQEDASVATETIILAGKHAGKESAAPRLSDVAILHVKMQPNCTWNHDLPDSHETAILYIRQGSVVVENTRVPPHYTVYLTKTGTRLHISTKEGADFLLLAGQPLNEPISAEGSMVMNYPDEINQAYSDYQQQKMGVPWDHKISDKEWKLHVQQYPSIYR